MPPEDFIIIFFLFLKVEHKRLGRYFFRYNGDGNERISPNIIVFAISLP